VLNTNTHSIKGVGVTTLDSIFGHPMEVLSYEKYFSDNKILMLNTLLFVFLSVKVVKDKNNVI